MILLPNCVKNFRLALLVWMVGGLAHAETPLHWSIVLEQPNQPGVEIGGFDGLPEQPLTFAKKVGDIQVDVAIGRKDDLVTVQAKASSATNTSCFLTLKSDFKEGVPYSYMGEVKERDVFRQSPHSPWNGNLGELVKQAVPMAAIKSASGFTVAISDTPAVYDNYTIQTIDPKIGTVSISSGDNGEITGPPPKTIKIVPYYHAIGNGQDHVFNAILCQSRAQNMNDLRRDTLFAVSKRWGDHVTGRFGATAFGTNYMLLRVNESKKSKFWVVAGMEYGNKSYSRDSFWQSMVLPPDYARESYLNEAKSLYGGAERPLFCMIWAYRTKLQGGEPDMEATQKTLKYIEDHGKDGWYHSYSQKGKKDYQSWYDTVAFNEDDVITYNQGLFAVALMSAEALGMKPTVSSAVAIQNYQSMFNEKGGYFPLSQQKDLVAMDPLVGDLLAEIFFKKALLSDESVSRHFQQVVAHSKTPYGFKVTCLADGSYAPFDIYSAKDFPVYQNAVGGLGSYQWGGSWYLYDMLCLMDCYLHQVPGAKEELVWRGALDFKLGGTYFENNNTVTGENAKPNQGWDGAVYALWKKLMDDGRADSSLLDAIDKL